MSQEEQDLIRIRAWDAYREALELFLTHKTKLAAWGALLSDLGERLSHKPLQLGDDNFSKVPTNEEFRSALKEFRQSITALSQTWIDARGFGFPVDPNVPSQVGGI